MSNCGAGALSSGGCVPLYPSQLLTDYQNYFKNTPAGSQQAWGGGMLSMGPNGIATYTSPSGQVTRMTENFDPNSLMLTNPDIKKTWENAYNFTYTGNDYRGNSASSGASGTNYNTGVYGAGNTGTTNTGTTNTGTTGPGSTGSGTSSPGTMFGSTQFQNDWNAYFNAAQPGQVIDWAGGKLTMGQNGQATYVGPDGATLTFNRNTNPMEIYNNPNIRSLWNQMYSYTGAGGAGVVSPTTGSPTMTAGQYALNALGGAWNTIQGYQPSAYPGYQPSQPVSPTNMQYAGFSANQPMAQIQAPTYQGMMGGDYDALQKALTTPGQIAAQDAYDQGYKNLINTMGGKGLYGSSIMQNQATQGLDKVLQNAQSINAAQAAATRYGMQQQDLNTQNQFNLNSAQLMKDQNYDLWRSGLADAERKQTYGQNKTNWDYTMGENQRNWQNQQALERFQYDLARNAYNDMQAENLINRYLQTAGLGGNLGSAAQSYQLGLQGLLAQQNAASQMSGAQTTSALLGSLGLLGGSTLGSDWFSGLFKN